jgi:threonine/homoserine/homoserine lactone efflux protein
LRTRLDDAPALALKPDQFFKQAFLITVLNPKAIVFYMAFFPLFVNPAEHQGLITFAVMAATIAVLTLGYGLVIVLGAHLLAKRANAHRIVGFLLNKITGLLLIFFGLKMALFK